MAKNDGGPAFPGGEAGMEIHMTGPDGMEDVRTIRLRPRAFRSGTGSRGRRCPITHRRS